MFVVSVSKNKIKKSLFVAAIVLALTSLIVVLFLFLSKSSVFVSHNGSSLDVSTKEKQLVFISGLGWEVDKEPVEVREVVIPETFDDVYEAYNQIQQQQGFDLLDYAGQRVKRWTYVVRNYPDTNPEDDFVRLNILVCDGVVIGGDVCSVKLDGFMHGFNMAE